MYECIRIGWDMIDSNRKTKYTTMHKELVKCSAVFRGEEKTISVVKKLGGQKT